MDFFRFEEYRVDQGFVGLVSLFKVVESQICYYLSEFNRVKRSWDTVDGKGVPSLFLFSFFAKDREALCVFFVDFFKASDFPFESLQKRKQNQI